MMKESRAASGSSCHRADSIMKVFRESITGTLELYCVEYYYHVLEYSRGGGGALQSIPKQAFVGFLPLELL
jgi:hypothetical protein